MTQNQNNIRSVEDIVRMVTERYDELPLDFVGTGSSRGAAKEEKRTRKEFQELLRTQITSLLTHLKEEIEKGKKKKNGDKGRNAPNRRVAAFNTAKDEDLSIINQALGI